MSRLNRTSVILQTHGIHTTDKRLFLGDCGELRHVEFVHSRWGEYMRHTKSGTLYAFTVAHVFTTHPEGLEIELDSIVLQPSERDLTLVLE